jgi:8-oxo-dGTP pyrophosphatase MutT (NUDIX family)
MSAPDRADFDPATVPISPAATVMLIRDAPQAPGIPDSADVPESAPESGIPESAVIPGSGIPGSGIEVFMLRRTANAAFGAGMYVFPGGRVDGVDHADDIAPYCLGLDAADASSQLGIDSGGLAYWVAAIRECFEEAGVLIAARRDGAPLALNNDDRHAVHAGDLSLAELCRRDDLVLDLSGTHYVAHWITPIGQPRRFDTRFFVCEMPEGQEPLHDDKETVDSLWVRPTEALRMEAERELMMMPPTIANLEFLAPHATAHDALVAGAAVGEPMCVLPKVRFDSEGRIVGLAMPGDPDYSDL